MFVFNKLVINNLYFKDRSCEDLSLGKTAHQRHEDSCLCRAVFLKAGFSSACVAMCDIRKNEL